MDHSIDLARPVARVHLPSERDVRLPAGIDSSPSNNFAARRSSARELIAMTTRTRFAALLAIAAASLATSASAQELFGNHALDSTDLKHALDLLGVSAFKFSVRPPSGAGPIALNYIIEEYSGGARTSSVNFAAALREKLPPGVPL